MRLTTLLIGSLVFAGSRAAAQTCTPAATPYFEFQVDRPATYIGDSTALPRPTAIRMLDGQGDLLVQFTVDTLGVPDAESFKVLKTPLGALGGWVRDAMPDWRFRPAVVGGCRVPQLVQTLVLYPLVRKAP